MSPIKAISGLFRAMVILQALLFSHAKIASMPLCFMPMSKPNAPEKKLIATILGGLDVVLDRSGISFNFTAIQCPRV